MRKQHNTKQTKNTNFRGPAPAILLGVAFEERARSRSVWLFRNQTQTNNQSTNLFFQEPANPAETARGIKFSKRWTSTYIYIYIYTYIHTRISNYIYIYTYTHKQV